jgi:N4-(beta-N-acetylglucosaminyl)-L-asparaginase
MEHGRDLDRRDFVRTGAIASAAIATGGWTGLTSTRVTGRPSIITSHWNATGGAALEAAWVMLAAGGSALDAVERAANMIEVDPEDSSVGVGGLPNAEGVVQLDASIMDGRTYSAGSVASLENIATPSSVARLIMERTDHVMLVGPGALRFAKEFGFEEQNLLTQSSRERWLQWREQLSPMDDYGAPEHLQDPPNRTGMGAYDVGHYGTVNVLGVDSNGDIAGVTTTSGLAWKIPGRIGDSPVIGAGLYVDNLVGAAGATGRGEDVIKSCASYFIVMRMREGRSPQAACEDACHMIAERYRAVGLDYIPPERFVAVSRDGDWGLANMRIVDPPPMTVADAAGGVRSVEGVALYEP